MFSYKTKKQLLHAKTKKKKKKKERKFKFCSNYCISFIVYNFFDTFLKYSQLYLFHLQAMELSFQIKYSTGL